MLRSILIITLAACCTGNLFAQKGITVSDAVTTTHLTDGQATEWPDPFRYYDGAAKVEFSFANNAQYLYLCIKATDEMAQRKLMHNGLVFTIATGKKTNSVVTFPLKHERPSGQQQGNFERGNQQRRDIKAMKQLMVSEIKTMKLEGFKNLPDGIYSITTKEGIQTAAGLDSAGVFILEYQIPLALLFEKTDTIKPVTASLFIKGIEMPAGSNMAPPGGGNGNFRGGGMPAPGGEMNGPDAGMGRPGNGGDFGGNGGPPMRGQDGPPGGSFTGYTANSEDKTIKLKLKLSGW